MAFAGDRVFEGWDGVDYQNKKTGAIDTGLEKLYDPDYMEMGTATRVLSQPMTI